MCLFAMVLATPEQGTGGQKSEDVPLSVRDAARFAPPTPTEKWLEFGKAYVADTIFLFRTPFDLCEMGGINMYHIKQK